MLEGSLCRRHKSTHIAIKNLAPNKIKSIKHFQTRENTIVVFSIFVNFRDRIHPYPHFRDHPILSIPNVPNSGHICQPSRLKMLKCGAGWSRAAWLSLSMWGPFPMGCWVVSLVFFRGANTFEFSRKTTNVILSDLQKIDAINQIFLFFDKL